MYCQNLTGKILMAVTLHLPIGSIAAEQKMTTTTQQAADAKEREGKTGTSNTNAARQLKALEADEKKAAQPPAKPASR